MTWHFTMLVQAEGFGLAAEGDFDLLDWWDGWLSPHETVIMGYAIQAWAMNMPFVLKCLECSTEPDFDTQTQAEQAGWIGIYDDPFSQWTNQYGICPKCRQLKEED